MYYNKDIEILLTTEMEGKMSCDAECITTYPKETLEVLCVKSLEIIAFLKSMGCEALLSGSGTAVFGIAEGKKQALKLADCLNNKFSDCFVFVCETAQCGCLL